MQNSILFGILLNLLSRPCTAPDLAQRYEVSVRSVYRYIDTLEAAGVPVRRNCGRKGGYALDSAHFIDKIYFTEEEYRYLSDLVDGTNLGGRTSDAVRTKIAALARMRGTDAGYRIASANLVIDADSWTDTGDKTRAINAAIEECRAVRIVYVDGDLSRTERLVEPHTLLFKQSSWYVYAYCTLRKDWRLFSLAGIAEFAVTENRFVRRIYDLDRVPWRTRPTSDALIPVTLVFDPSVLHLAADWLGAASLRGNVARARLPLNHTTLAKLLSFGAAVRVDAPARLRERVAESLRNAARAYDEKTPHPPYASGDADAESRIQTAVTKN